jgi:hypothetical protein
MERFNTGMIAFYIISIADIIIYTRMTYNLSNLKTKYHGQLMSFKELKSEILRKKNIKDIKEVRFIAIQKFLIVFLILLLIAINIFF